MDEIRQQSGVMKLTPDELRLHLDKIDHIRGSNARWAKLSSIAASLTRKDTPMPEALRPKRYCAHANGTRAFGAEPVDTKQEGA